MSRELKFRVWSKENKKYIPPSHIAINGNGILLITYSGMYLDFENEHYAHLSQKYVAQQFTGLLDKNGKDIYEGDILKYNTNYNESLGGQVCNGVSVVSFENGSFMIDEDFADKDWAVEHIVIGNIFKNPELLKA
jgi:uncharacterized phage protein (TIGR01671 family)